VTTKPEGIGLGLYYVHSLAAAIGAELTLEDREFGGAVARISLPIVPSGSSSDSTADLSIQAPDWRIQA
jgi:signal transduction histidine kinase